MNNYTFGNVWQVREFLGVISHHDAIIIMMRTTVNLPDDLYALVKSVANNRGVSLGDALTQLVRSGLQPVSLQQSGSAFPCFQVAPDAPPITLEQTLAAEDDFE